MLWSSVKYFGSAFFCFGVSSSVSYTHLVHLSDWPQPLEGIADDGVIEQTERARAVIATAMRLRNEQQLKVRQPCLLYTSRCV